MAEHLSDCSLIDLTKHRGMHQQSIRMKPENGHRGLTDTNMTKDQNIHHQGRPLIQCSNLWVVFGPDADAISANDAENRTKEQLLYDTGNVVAVRDVSFEVCPGETFVIMGLSGSGKSTLVRCLSRLIEPTSGRIFIREEN